MLATSRRLISISLVAKTGRCCYSASSRSGRIPDRLRAYLIAETSVGDEQ